MAEYNIRLCRTLTHMTGMQEQVGYNVCAATGNQFFPASQCQEGRFWVQLLSQLYGACPKNETCAFSGRLTHHCTVADGVGYEKILDWPPWKEPLPRRSWLTTA